MLGYNIHVEEKRYCTWTLVTTVSTGISTLKLKNEQQKKEFVGGSSSDKWTQRRSSNYLLLSLASLSLTRDGMEFSLASLSHSLSLSKNGEYSGEFKEASTIQKLDKNVNKSKRPVLKQKLDIKVSLSLG